ncbi:hypothetical protein GCM10027610_012840 [Dactylosporangium cerinum]
MEAGLDLCLTAHLLTAAAIEGPLLLLGHPGAGKSLLTKVLAARLPPDRYTVVRVPLRAVPANGRILAQIDAALAAATNEAVRWRPLVEQSRDTVRVVLLDGLDELLQATPDDRTAYLDDVADFQRNEASQDRPAVVIVTSRTVVADRIDIPAGTTVIKLDDFANSQVAAWLDVWNATNAEAVTAGALRPLPPARALLHPELARQPLLLLMLALYAADPTVPVLEAGVSATELYRRLFESFAWREVGNRPQPPPPQHRAAAVRERLDRLSVAAFAMFNRGRQEVTGAELAADLVALRMADTDVLGDRTPGQRLLGEFFFVHVAEAVTRDEARRAYEFLHATFGEYLIARRVVDVLAETAERAFTGRFAPHEPDDTLLFALLSHEALAVRRPTLAFVRDLFATLPEADRCNIPQLLNALLADYRSVQRADRFTGYRPRPVDRARELAAYSANLVLLRTAIAGGLDVPLPELFPDSRAPLASAEAWRSTVGLWKAALDDESWESTVTTLALSDAGVRSTLDHANALPLEIVEALLIGDTELELVVRYGLAAALGKTYPIYGTSWADTVRTAALAFMVGPHMNLDLPASADGATDDEIKQAVRIVWRAASSRRDDLTLGGWRTVIDWTLRVGSIRHLDGPLIADLMVRFPQLLEPFPKVNLARLATQPPDPDITVTTYRWNS